jgi:Spy/CpxP family protein refolding chaperone
MTEKRWVMSPRKRKAFMAAAARGAAPTAAAAARVRGLFGAPDAEGNGREEPRCGRRPAMEGTGRCGPA